MLVPLTITLAPTIGSPETAVTRPLIVFSAFTGFAEEGGYRGPAGREHHAVTLDTRPQPLRRERAVDDGDDLLVHRPDAHTRREIDLRIVVSERVIAPFLDFGEELPSP